MGSSRLGCRKSILNGLSTYVKEHFTNAAYGAYPIENDTKIAIIIVANKYSPSNFWYEQPAKPCQELSSR
jgi:hypothetical protein